MRQYVFISLAILGFACHSTKKSERKLLQLSLKANPDKDLRCIKLNRYNADELKQLSLFKEASLIELVSFEQPVEDLSSSEPPKKIRVIENFYSKNDTDSHHLDSSKVIIRQWCEMIEVKENDKAVLGDILFNYGFKKQPGYGVISQCYLPRNAILFYNSKDEVYAAIEICFECSRMEVFPPSLDTGDWCTEKTDMLRDFFSKSGIKIGIPAK